MFTRCKYICRALIKKCNTLLTYVYTCSHANNDNSQHNTITAFVVCILVKLGYFTLIEVQLNCVSHIWLIVIKASHIMILLQHFEQCFRFRIQVSEATQYELLIQIISCCCDKNQQWGRLSKWVVAFWFDLKATAVADNATPREALQPSAVGAHHFSASSYNVYYFLFVSLFA